MALVALVADVYKLEREREKMTRKKVILCDCYYCAKEYELCSPDID